MQFFDILLTLVAVILAGWYLWRTLIVRTGCAGCSSGSCSQCSGQGTQVSWLKPADSPGHNRNEIGKIEQAP